jgi:hypothetical protein
MCEAKSQQAQENVRAQIQILTEIFHAHFQQRLPCKRRAGIEHSGSATGTLELLLDLRESALNALLARCVGADTDGLASGTVAILHQQLVVSWRASKQSDRV